MFISLSKNNVYKRSYLLVDYRTVKVKNLLLKMNHKNILYGGDVDREFKYKSMGDFVITSLRRNGDRKALVSMAKYL